MIKKGSAQGYLHSFNECQELWDLGATWKNGGGGGGGTSDSKLGGGGGDTKKLFLSNS